MFVSDITIRAFRLNSWSGDQKFDIQVLLWILQGLREAVKAGDVSAVKDLLARVGIKFNICDNRCKENRH